jgi:hypothetical protein
MNCVDCHEQAPVSSCGECSGDPTSTFRDPALLAKAAIAALACALLVEVFVAVASLNRASLALALLRAPLGVTNARLHAADRMSTLATHLEVVALALTAVPFLLWFRCARLNAEYFAPKAMSSTPGWAIGAWFVPVGFLWFPKRVANDIRRATADSPATHHGAPAGGPSRVLLNTWWALWVVTLMGRPVLGLLGDLVYAAVTDAGSDRAQTLGLLHERALVDAGTAVAGVLAASAAALVVRQVTVAQQALAVARAALSR